MLLKSFLLRLRELVLELAGIAGVAGMAWLAIQSHGWFPGWLGDWRMAASLAVLFGGWALLPAVMARLRRLAPYEDTRDASWTEYDVPHAFGLPLIYLLAGLLAMIGISLAWSGWDPPVEDRLALVGLAACGCCLARHLIMAVYYIPKLRKLDSERREP